MLNKGFGSKVRDKEFKADAGPAIFCPSCKKILLEGTVERIKTRCKHCGKWVYLFKKVNKS